MLCIKIKISFECESDYMSHITCKVSSEICPLHLTHYHKAGNKHWAAQHLLARLVRNLNWQPYNHKPAFLTTEAQLFDIK